MTMDVSAHTGNAENRPNPPEQTETAIRQQKEEIARLAAKRDVVAAELKALQQRLLAGKVEKNNALKEQLRRLRADTDAFALQNNLTGTRGDIEAISRGEAALRGLAGMEAELEALRSRTYLPEKELKQAECPKELRWLQPRSPEDAAELATTDAALAKKLSRNGLLLFLFGICALLTISFTAAGIAFGLLANEDFDPLLPAFISFGLAFFCAVLSAKIMVEDRRRRRALAELYRKWGAEKPERFPESAKAYGDYLTALTQKKNRLAEDTARISALQDRLVFARRAAEEAVSTLALPRENAAAAAGRLLNLAHELEQRRRKCEELQQAIDPGLPETPPETEPPLRPDVSEEQLNGIYSALCAALGARELELERLQAKAGALHPAPAEDREEN